MRTRWRSSIGKVLVITACWTFVLLLAHLDHYFLVQDLIGLGKVSGHYAFWPDLVGMAVLGIGGGLIGGTLLVFKVNAGYRHRTFLSGILSSVILFLLIYVALAVLLLFGMTFLFFASQDGWAPALQKAWDNVRINLYTPSFITSMIVWGLFVSATQFMLQVNDKFGPGVLWKLMTGKYYHPREEERVFMFLDLRSSTEIAERIGPQRFFELLKELFQDITKPVLDSLGDIYQYVGDEVVITWTVQRGFKDGNCIECFFRIERALACKRADYLARFGVEPTFKAGVHVGEAMVGEMGVVKKDIVYSGDVLNTTSRIQQECNRHAVDLLASSDVLERLPGKPAYVSRSIGEIRLRGKSRALTLSEVQAG